eukprot:scaffold279180_cov21-Tisochrysis_lutea.AAC.2
MQAPRLNQCPQTGLGPWTLELWRGGLLLSEPEIKNALWHVHTGCPKPSICKLSTEAHEAWFMHALVA